MDKLIIGRYIVGDSFIHRLDPRSKLLAMLIYIIVIFWANNPVTYAVITLFTLFLVFLSKIKLGFFLGGIKPVSYTHLDVYKRQGYLNCSCRWLGCYSQKHVYCGTS